MNTTTFLRDVRGPFAASASYQVPPQRRGGETHGGIERHAGSPVHGRSSGCGRPPGSLIESAFGAVEMTWQRLFPGEAEQVPNARRFVRALLADTAQATDAELIVSELAGNALRHTRSGGPGGHFLVELRRGKRVRVAVYDAGGGGVPRLPGPEPVLFGEGGRGLFMVAAVAGEVGCDGCPVTGHVVWACLPVDEPGPARPG